MYRTPIAGLCLALWAGAAAAQDAASRVDSEAARTCDYVADALASEVDRIAGSVADQVMDARGRAAADRLDARFHAADFLIDVGRAYADTMDLFLGVGLKAVLARFAAEFEAERAEYDRIKAALFADGPPDEAVLGEAAALAGRLETIRDAVGVAVLAAMGITGMDDVTAPPGAQVDDFTLLANRMIELIPLHAQVDLIDKHGVTVPMVAELELGGIDAADAWALEQQQIAERVLTCVEARRAELDRVPIDGVDLSGPATLSIIGEDYSVEYTGGQIELSFGYALVSGRLVFPDDDLEFGLAGSTPVHDDGTFLTTANPYIDGRLTPFAVAGRVARDRGASNGWRAEGRFVLDETSLEDWRVSLEEDWGPGARIGGSWQAQ